MNAIGCLSTSALDKDSSETSVTVGSKLSGDPPPVVPSEHGKGRSLVLCFDGTNNQFGEYNSNIVRFVSLLEKDDRNKQLVYYQAGIGTYTSPQIKSPIISTIAEGLDSVFAWNLGDHIQGGYQFLMQNYIAGDKVCLFGFSRGAYTARCLAGMLHKVGLLTGGNVQQVPFAYKTYQRIDDDGWKESNGFKKTFSIDVPIEFVGVWDTVDSVGYVPRGLPFSTSNNSIRIFRHAVSLDEHRGRYKTNLWKVPTEEDVKLGTKASNYDLIDGIPDGTDVEEVWFAGCHKDIGGSSVVNNTLHSLARIPLRWMVRECFKAGTGILFYSDKLREIGLDPSSLYPVVLPRPPPLSVDGHKIRSRSSDLFSFSQWAAPLEETEELNDALSSIHDQLEINKGWWVLEYLPLPLSHQEGNRKWVAEFKINAGRPREIPDQRVNGFKVHRSVKMRMEAEYEDEKKPKGGKYIPKAKFEVEPKWIG